MRFSRAENRPLPLQREPTVGSRVTDARDTGREGRSRAGAQGLRALQARKQMVEWQAVGRGHFPAVDPASA